MTDRAFYLNLTILNKDEVVKETVKKKAGSGIFGKAMSFAANSVVSDKAVVDKLSKALLEKIPAAISDMVWYICYIIHVFITLISCKLLTCLLCDLIS